MNPPPIDGSRISTYFGPLFARQLDHGLVRKFVDYVTFINAFVLVSPEPLKLITLSP